jgi:DNA (cytosine-5)-methyltransferase 1
MTHGSLFSGIGGFDLAAEWMGWQNVFHCEWNTFGQRVLKHYWPDAISYNDITKTDFTIHRGRIDILTGGFPCQPYSMAGKRLGKEDDRHLWPEMLRAIREIQPRWVVGENVLGLVNWSDGLVFHEVQADLEAEGYEVQPFVLPAVSVNAPHRRDRVWFVAKNTRLNGCLFGESIEEGAEIRQQRDIGAGDTERICGEEMAGITSNAEGVGWRWRRCAPCHQWQNIIQQSGDKGFGSCGTATHSNGNGQHGSDCQHQEQSDEGGQYAQRDVEQIGQSHAIDSIGIGRDKSGDERGNIDEKQREWKFGTTNCTSDWWRNFPSVSPICNGNDGISDRLDGITFSKWRQESIKAGGNAVVPQVVLQIFRTIEEYEKTHAQ